MIESIPVGKLTCDYIDQEDFWELCKKWLSSTEFHHVVTLNPEMVILAEHDTQFRDTANEADLRVPDGSGLIWAHWYVRSEFWSLIPSLIAFSFRHAERITGVDTVKNLSRLAEEMGKSVYLLGGTQTQVNETAKLLQKEFPKLTVYTSEDHAFDISGPDKVLKDIQEKAPDILFVAYGAHKQTPWIEKHRKDLPSVKIAVGVGGAFAILSEDKPRAPQLFRQFNAEWLWRLILEPSRFPRIWHAVVDFPRLIQRQKQEAK